MTRWMIVAAAAGAMTSAAYGQASSSRAGGGDGGAVVAPARVVEAEAIVVAQADDVPTPPTPAPARARAGAAAAPPAPVAPARVPAPPTPMLGNVVFDTAQPGKMEKVIYLGAVTSSAPAAMREQLKLSPGVGLVVDRVEPDSAAEKAGLKQHDVIEKLDDQMLINPEQLATLLRSRKAGDEVTLAIVRQGEHQSIKAKLEEKEINTATLRLARGGNFINTGANQFNVGTTFTPNAITLDRDGNTLMLGGGGGFGGAGYGGGFGAAGGGKRVTVRTMDDGKQTTVWADDDVSISIDRAGGKITNMVVKDRKTDKALYTGNGEGDGLKLLYDARPDLRDKIKKAQDAATREPARLPVQLLKGVAAGGGGGGKVVRWQDDDHVLLLRMAGRSPSYLLALSKKDGHTVFDGPVASDADRQSVPPEVVEQFQLLVAQPEMAQELGAPAKGAPGPTLKVAPGPRTPARDGL